MRSSSVHATPFGVLLRNRGNYPSRYTAYITIFFLRNNRYFVLKKLFKRLTRYSRDFFFFFFFFVAIDRSMITRCLSIATEFNKLINIQCFSPYNNKSVHSLVQAGRVVECPPSCKSGKAFTHFDYSRTVCGPFRDKRSSRSMFES